MNCTSAAFMCLKNKIKTLDKADTSTLRQLRNFSILELFLSGLQTMVTASYFTPIQGRYMR